MTRSTDRLVRLARRGAASFLAAACLAAAPSFAATQAGVSAAVRGDVERSAVETGSVSKVSSGQEIFLGDGIRSGKGSGMQLMLLDQSVFTVGADSELTIDRFVFDPNANAGQITASLGKGVMRFVSGKVARGDPEDMQIKLPVGTVGIRGTFGAMGYDGQNAFVVLLGPGSQNDANANQGRIDVNLGGADFQLTQPGFGVTFTPGAGPQLVRFTPDMLGQMGYSTTGNGDGGGDNGGGDGDNGGGTDQGDGQQGGGLGEGDTSQVKQAANTGIGQAKGTSQQTNLIFQNANTFSTFNTQVATNQTRDLGQQGQLGGTFAPSLVSLTRTADLVAQNSGSVVFAQQGIPFFFGTGGFEGGTFNVSVLVNFAAQQIGGGGSLVRFNGQSVNFAEFLLPGIPFTNGVFNLAEYFISPGQSSGGGVCSSACDAFITLEFFNAGGFRPGLMDVMALLTDGNSGLLASGDEIIKRPELANQFNFFNDTTLADLATIPSGIFNYTGSSTFVQTGLNGQLSDIVGTAKASLQIDFGARAVGGGNSAIAVNTAAAGGNIVDQTAIPAVSFDNLFGGHEFLLGPGSNPNFGSTEITLMNAEGIVANRAAFDIEYLTELNHGASVILSGPRTPGAAPGVSP